MARQPRLAVAGQPHQLVQRGHNGQAVFIDDADRQLFLRLLREAAAAQHVPIHAYALPTSQVHLLATPSAAKRLSRMMQSLGRATGPPSTAAMAAPARCGTGAFAPR